jgi:uncharacterized protein involved in exopolysaccharide biosynthesis
MITILSARDLVRLFFIFRREFKWAFLATVLVVVLCAFLLPSKYESEARVLVKPSRENATLPIELSDRQALGATFARRDATADEEKALTGNPIVMKVAENYLAEASRQPAPDGFMKTIKYYLKKAAGAAMEGIRSVFVLVGVLEEQTPPERLAKKLEKNFNVTHGTGSNVMEISFTWDDPAVAKQILASWLNIYEEERIRGLGRNGVSSFYESQGKKAEVMIDDYKNRLNKLLNGIGAADVKQRIESLTKRLDTLSSQRGENAAELNSLKAGASNAQAHVGKLPKEITTEREISLNPTQLDLKVRLNELQVKRINELRVYVEGSPPIKNIDESIAHIKQQIANEPEKLQRSEHHALNSLSTTLQQNMLQKQVRISELTALLAEQDKQIAALVTELQRVQVAEPEIARLQRLLSAGEKNYALYTESLEKARIDTALDSSRISNIAVIEEATLNPARVFPKTLPMLLAAVPAGILVGLFVLYLCYLLDLRIHDGGRVEKMLGVPLWATLHDTSDSTSLPGTNPLSIGLYHIYNMLPLDQIEERGITLALTSADRGEGIGSIIEHLRSTLVEHGHNVRIGGDTRAAPGEVVLCNCANMLNDRDAFIRLRIADLIVLVVEAKKTTIPAVKRALEVLSSSFGKVQGVIVNRCQYEIPAKLLAYYARWRGA